MYTLFVWGFGRDNWSERKYVSSLYKPENKILQYDGTEQVMQAACWCDFIW